MNSKKITKTITALIIVATILGTLNMVLGATIPTGDDATGYTGTGLDTTTNRIITIVQFICYAAAVILLVVLGVKWLVAAPDQKADMKKSAIVYVVGAFMVFAAGAILGVIKNVSTNTITNTSSTPAKTN